jgi:hypothetical protein
MSFRTSLTGVNGMDRTARWLAGVFAGCGVALVPWTGVLIGQLHGRAGQRGFGSSWVGALQWAGPITES